MDGNDNDNYKRQVNDGTAIRLYPSIVQNIQPTETPPRNSPLRKCTIPPPGGNVMMPWDRWDLMGRMVGAAAVVRRRVVVQ